MNERLLEVLEQYGIEYRTEGTNVTDGWIEVNCPFCSDPSYHLGISPSLGFNCWVCGEKGGLRKLFNEIHAFNGVSLYNLINYIRGDVKTLSEQAEPILHRDYLLPKDVIPTIPRSGIDYLRSRGFDSGIMEKYRLQWGGTTGQYAHRIIIPIYQDQALMGFTARSIGAMKPRYKNAEGVAINKMIYNIDNAVHDTVCVVEGPTDVWRIGNGAVAVFGIEYTVEQVAILSQLRHKGVRRVIVLFDNEPQAQERANSLASELSVIYDNVEIISGDCDPADMSSVEIFEIQKLIRRI